MRVSTVFGIPDVGTIFTVQERGGWAALGSQTYGAEHLKRPNQSASISLWVTLGHRCLRSDTCREGIRQVTGTSWMTGLERIDLEQQELPFSIEQKYIDHIWNISAHALSESREIRHAVTSGRMVIADTYFDNASGKIAVLGVWTAALPTNPTENKRDPEISAAVIRAILNGEDIPLKNDSLQRLRDIVRGNLGYVVVRSQEMVMPLEYIVRTCSDSRNFLKQALSGPHTKVRGKVEICTNAGLEMNDRIVDGLRLSYDQSREQLARANREKDPTRCTFAGHSDCGANKEALRLVRKGEVDPNVRLACAPGSVTELTTNIARRFANEYLREYPHDDGRDRRLLHAARVGAVAAINELYDTHTPAADYLIGEVVNGRLNVNEAVAYLSSGFVEYGPNRLPSRERVEIAKRGPTFKTVSLPQLSGETIRKLRTEEERKLA